MPRLKPTTTKRTKHCLILDSGYKNNGITATLVSPHVYIENGVHPNTAIWLSWQQRVWRPESLVLASWEPLTNWPRHHWRHPPHIGANHHNNLGSKYFSYIFILSCLPCIMTKGRIPLPNQMNFWKSAKEGGGSFPIQKMILQILGTLNRAFWAWNW